MLRLRELSLLRRQCRLHHFLKTGGYCRVRREAQHAVALRNASQFSFVFRDYAKRQDVEIYALLGNGQGEQAAIDIVGERAPFECYFGVGNHLGDHRLKRVKNRPVFGGNRIDELLDLQSCVVRFSREFSAHRRSVASFLGMEVSGST